MSFRTPEKRQSTVGYNIQSNRRKKKDSSVDGSGYALSNSTADKSTNKVSREDPGAFILKLLHNGRKSDLIGTTSQPTNNVRSQSRTKYCDSVNLVSNANDSSTHSESGRVSINSTINLFTTPPPQRKGRYSVFSTCGTNNQKCFNYPNSSGGKSLSNSSNPTNFALPMYMRSPNPESIPMPCGFPIEG